MAVSLVGSTVGSIQILDEIGRGGMGTVYLGFDERLERRVAVKAVDPSRRMEASSRARFLREARILSQLEHPSICRVYELIREGEDELIVLELVQGKTLGALIREGHLSPRERARIADQVSSALVAAHSLSVVHRDLKPDNIMVGPGCEVKVLDFGLACTERSPAEEETGPAGATTSGRTRRSFDDQPSLSTAPTQAPGSGTAEDDVVTELGDLLGTPRYMSPEQAQGAAVTAASDMYSFGLVLQELFTGRPAYPEGLDRAALYLRATWADTLPVEGVQPQLARLVERLKSLDPARRPTAVETADRLRWIWDTPRRRLLRLGVVTVAASLVVAALASLLGLRRARSALAVARAAEARAEQDAAEARKVTDFLVGVFQVADPGEARGRAVTAKEILDRGAKRVERELEHQPLTRARLEGTIGRVYLLLGLYDQAGEHLEQALSTREANLPAGDPELADSLVDLATLRRRQGNPASARALLERALAIRETELGPSDPAVAAVRSDLALALRDLGQAEEAARLLRSSLAILEGAPEHDSVELAATLNDLATVLIAQGHLAEAEPYLRRTLAIREKVLGADHFDVATSLSNLATLLISQHRNAEAEPLLERAVEIGERVLGPDHPSLASYLSSLASLYRRQERFLKAEPLYRRALEIRERALGPNHPEVAASVNNLALLEADLGHLAEAEQLHRRALAIREASLGPDHRDVGISLNNLADVLLQLGRPEEAEPVLLRAVSNLERSLRPEHPSLSYPLLQLGKVYRDSGRFAAGDEALGRALAIREKAFGSDAPEVAFALDELGQLERLRGRARVAEERFRRSLAILETHYGPDHAELAPVLANLGRHLAEQQRKREARALLRRALAIQERELGPDHAEVKKLRAEVDAVDGIKR